MTTEEQFRELWEQSDEIGRACIAIAYSGVVNNDPGAVRLSKELRALSDEEVPHEELTYSEVDLDLLRLARARNSREAMALAVLIIEAVGIGHRPLLKAAEAAMRRRFGN